MSLTNDLGQATAADANADDDDETFISVGVANGWDVVKYIKRTRGVLIAERTVTDAHRRKLLGYYQVGQSRYTTPKLIDRWLDTHCLRISG